MDPTSTPAVLTCCAEQYSSSLTTPYKIATISLYLFGEHESFFSLTFQSGADSRIVDGGCEL